MKQHTNCLFTWSDAQFLNINKPVIKNDEDSLLLGIRATYFPLGTFVLEERGRLSSREWLVVWLARGQEPFVGFLTVLGSLVTS